MRDRLRKAFSQFLAGSHRILAARWAKATATILMCLLLFCTGLYLGLRSALKVAVFPPATATDNPAPNGSSSAPPAQATSKDGEAGPGISSTTLATAAETGARQSGASPGGQGSSPVGSETTPVDPESTPVTVQARTLAEILKDLSLPVEGQIRRKEGWYYLEVFSEWRYHRGIDFQAPAGHPVKAPLAGTVKDLYQNVHLGTVVILSHEGDVETLYGCITPGEDILPGKKVAKGEVLGCISDSGPREGDSTPHLHFEVHFRGELVLSDRYLGAR